VATDEKKFDAEDLYVDPSVVLTNFPIASFGSLMGLMGLSLAWQQAHSVFGSPIWVVYIIGAIATLAFGVQSASYLNKVIRTPSNVVSEFANSSSASLFGAPLIVMLQLPLFVSQINILAARIIWVIGTACMIGFTFLMVLRWIDVKQLRIHASPSWIVPVVGLIIVPLAVPSLGWSFSARRVMVFCWAVGFFLLVPVFTLVLSRLMFEDRIPDSVQPSLLILVAPFAVGFTSYTEIVPKFDLFAEGLVMISAFVLLALAGRLRHLMNCCPFRLAWWAVAFPLASSASMAIKYAKYEGDNISMFIAETMLAIATIVIIALFVRTIMGMVRGDIKIFVSQSL